MTAMTNHALPDHGATLSPELLALAPIGHEYIGVVEEVGSGRINPGRVIDFETDLDHIADAYVAMDERRAVKSLVRVEATA
jgi:threonine dehydrogenase-like Zn-dependent dehydrogenase